MKNYFENYVKAIQKPLLELQVVFHEEKDYFTKILNELETTANILDVGCGTGRVFLDLAKNFECYHFFGIETNEKMFSTALRNTRAMMNTNIKQITALDTKFPNDFFDFIYSTYNLLGSFTEEQRKLLLSEKLRIAKSGSKIATLTWNRKDSTTQFLQKYYRSIGIEVYESDIYKTITDKGVFYRFGEENLKNMYNDLGLINLEVEAVGGLWLAICGEKR